MKKIKTKEEILEEFCYQPETRGWYKAVLKAMEAYANQFHQPPDGGVLPLADDLKPFLYWVFHKADRIWVEHTLGWRENAIEEMYEVYLRMKQ